MLKIPDKEFVSQSFRVRPGLFGGKIPLLSEIFQGFRVFPAFLVFWQFRNNFPRLALVQVKLFLSLVKVMFVMLYVTNLSCKVHFFYWQGALGLSQNKLKRA